MSSDNKNYAYKWAKAQSAGSTFISKNSSAINVEHIKEEMNFWKIKLQNSTPEARRKIVDKLLDLRAKQTIAYIENLHEDNHPLAEKKIDQAITHYYTDCFRLIVAAKHL